MVSSNGNVFGLTGSLCEKFTGHWWIPLTKSNDAKIWCFFYLRLKNGGVNNRDVGDLRRHYDVTVTLPCDNCSVLNIFPVALVLHQKSDVLLAYVRIVCSLYYIQNCMSYFVILSACFLYPAYAYTMYNNFNLYALCTLWYAVLWLWRKAVTTNDLNVKMMLVV